MLRFIYLMHVTIYDMQNIVFYVYLYIYTICNRYIPIVNTVCMCHLLWVGKRWVGELLLGFRNVVLLPSWASFAPHFVYVKASRPPHVLNVWLEVGKGVLSVFLLVLTNPLVLVNFIGDHDTH